MKSTELKDICRVITCGVAKRPEYIDDGIPFLSSKNVKENRFILNHYNMVSTEDYLQLTKSNKPEIGDILYTRVGSFGEAAVVDFDFDFAIFVSLTLIKPKKDIVTSRYLMYYLNSPLIRNLARSSTSGIGVQNLNVNTVRKFPISLPPIAEQKKIAAILDAADAYRQKTKALIDKYNALSQSLFLEMFGDPVRNPMGWEKVKLGELGKWMSGGTPSRAKSEYFDGNIPWLSSGELEQMYISDSKEHISEVAIKESNAKIIEKGSLLLGMYDTAALKSTISSDKLSCNQAIAYCKLNNDMVNTIFVYKIIQLAKEHYRRLQRGVRQKNLNLSMVKGIDILHPPLHLQNQFAQRIEAIEKQKAQAEASLAKAEDLFGSLLQGAFRGELSH